LARPPRETDSGKATSVISGDAELTRKGKKIESLASLFAGCRSQLAALDVVYIFRVGDRYEHRTNLRYGLRNSPAHNRR
jgi:hypothetical protein